MTDPGAAGPADAGGSGGSGETADVLVIGGGFAGLVTAWELGRQGRHALVLEADDALGGCVGRHTVGGLELDSGAESFAVARPTVLSLAADLGLAGKVVAPSPLGSWAWLGGEAIPLPPAGLLGVPVHPLSAPVRHALGPLGSARAALDRFLPASVGAGDDGEAVTFGAIVRARMGRRVVQRLVEPVVGGVHSASPDELDADVVAPGLRAALAQTGSLAKAVEQLRRPLGPAGAAVRGIDGGVHLLIDALASRLGSSVRTGVRVSALRADGDGWQADAAAADGSMMRIRARAVVIAVPAPVAAALLAPVLTGGAAGRESAGGSTDGSAGGGSAGGEGLDALASPDTTDVVLATIVLDEPLLDAAPRGTGILVARQASDVRAKALTHATAKWSWLADAAGPGRHVVRLSYGRGGDDGTADRLSGTAIAEDPELFRRIALADAATLLGVSLDPARVQDFAIRPWSSALPRPGAGHAGKVRSLRAQLAARPGIAITGAWIAGNGLAAITADARRTAVDLAG